jgi:hypothetical protein
MNNYMIPNFGPWASNRQNCLWIKISAHKYGSQDANVRGSAAQSAVRLGALEETFTFLAPPDIQLNLDHSWENYENITSRMANVISNWMIPWQDLKSAYRGTTWDNISDIFKGGGENGFGTLSANLGKMLKGDVVNYRVDAPLVYKGTQNLEYNFNFDLASYTGDTGLIENLVKDLMMYSSPKKKENDLLSITPPHIFKIETIPTGIIFLQAAALKTVQPELSYPFINGHPTVCKLQLTFQDITPLFDTTFVTGSSVTVTGGGTTTPTGPFLNQPSAM